MELRLALSKFMALLIDETNALDANELARIASIELQAQDKVSHELFKAQLEIDLKHIVHKLTIRAAKKASDQGYPPNADVLARFLQAEIDNINTISIEGEKLDIRVYAKDGELFVENRIPAPIDECITGTFIINDADTWQ